VDILTFSDLAVTLPLGMLSDRGFRRTVLILNFMGFIAMYAWLFGVGYFETIISRRFMLLAPFLTIIGGGECVFMSNIAAVIADIASGDIERYIIFCTAKKS
jgi:MFS family permease